MGRAYKRKKQKKKTKEEKTAGAVRVLSFSALKRTSGLKLEENRKCGDG